MDRFKELVEDNPVKFIGVVEAFFAFVALALLAYGVVLPAGIVAGFLTFLTIALSWWTQNNKTVPEYRAEHYTPDGANDNLDFSLDDLLFEDD